MSLLSHTLLPPAFEILRLPTHGRAGRLLPFNRPTLLPRPCFQSTPRHLSCLQLVRTMFDPHTCHPLRYTIAVSRSPNGTFISFFPQHSSTSGGGPPDQLAIPHPTQQARNDADAACVFEYNEEVVRNRKLEPRRPGVHECTRAGPVTLCGQFCTSFSRLASQPNHMTHPHLAQSQETGFGMGPPSIPRGHKCTRSRSVPCAVDFSMLQHTTPSFHIQHPSTVLDESILLPIPQHHNNLGPHGSQLRIDTSSSYDLDYRQYHPRSGTGSEWSGEKGSDGGTVSRLGAVFCGMALSN